MSLLKYGVSLSSLERFRSLQNLLMAVVAVGVGAAAVAVVDGAGGGHVQGAEEVVAGALAVELAEAVADVAAGLVVRNELLGLEASGAGIAHVDTRHHAGGSSKNLCAQTVSTAPACVPR